MGRDVKATRHRLAKAGPDDTMAVWDLRQQLIRDDAVCVTVAAASNTRLRARQGRLPLSSRVHEFSDLDEDAAY